MTISVNPMTAGSPVPAAAPSGFDPGVPYSVVTTNGGTLLFTGPGVLYGANVTAAGVLSTMKIYDGLSTSGVALSSALSVVAVGKVDLGTPDGFGIQFLTGLFVQMAGTTPPTAVIFWKPGT